MYTLFTPFIGDHLAAFKCYGRLADLFALPRKTVIYGTEWLWLARPQANWHEHRGKKNNNLEKPVVWPSFTFTDGCISQPCWKPTCTEPHCTICFLNHFYTSKPYLTICMNILKRFLTRAHCNADLNIKAAVQSLVVFSVKKANWMAFSCCFGIKLNISDMFSFFAKLYYIQQISGTVLQSFKTMAISTNNIHLKCFPHSQDDKSFL